MLLSLWLQWAGPEGNKSGQGKVSHCVVFLCVLYRRHNARSSTRVYMNIWISQCDISLNNDSCCTLLNIIIYHYMICCNLRTKKIKHQKSRDLNLPTVYIPTNPDDPSSSSGGDKVVELL